MNDRFKFRIPMFSDKDSFIEFQYCELGDVIECTLCGYNGEPQQCTGLKDKNGKLIYEGDVVNGSCGVYWGKMIVEYNVAGFVLNKNGKYLNFLEGENYIEVIGNKFENPELLKECE